MSREPPAGHVSFLAKEDWNYVDVVLLSCSLACGNTCSCVLACLLVLPAGLQSRRLALACCSPMCQACTQLHKDTALSEGLGFGLEHSHHIQVSLSW